MAAAERPQEREIAGAIVAEQKVRADPDLGDAQPVHQNGSDKRLGIPAGQLGREPNDRRTLQAGRVERLQLLGHGHQHGRCFVGTDHSRGMGVEGHDDGGRPPLAGHATDSLENLSMAAVYPVEVAERQHRARPARRPRVVGKMDDVHGVGVGDVGSDLDCCVLNQDLTRRRKNQDLTPHHRRTALAFLM